MRHSTAPISYSSSTHNHQTTSPITPLPPTMDFAPYQDTSPETSRALSPPPPQRSSSRSPAPRSPPPNRPSSDPFSSALLPPPSHFSDGANGDLETGRVNVNLFETSLPLRLDYEAMLAYLLLPPAGGVLLLVVERKSDYVRYFPPPSLHSHGNYSSIDR